MSAGWGGVPGGVGRRGRVRASSNLVEGRRGSSLVLPSTVCARPWASVWSHPNSCSVCWGSVDTQDERVPRKLGRVAPTQGAEWGMLTILLMSLIAEGSELLIQGFQRDAHGIVPALPGIEQQAVVS